MIYSVFDFSSSSATPPLRETPEYTVSEISGLLKQTIEEKFHRVCIRGEISGYNGPHASGHAYFSLKDTRSRLEAIVWKTTIRRLKFLPEEGMEVLASGKLSIYPGSSKYQIIIDNLEPAGVGALMALLEERKKRLQAEGIFDAERKRKIPFMPRVIGVITSPSGAVIQDILHRIRDRFPLHVLLWPVRVQGEMAKAEIISAIQGFNSFEAGEAVPRPDVLILARGGGSLEDLWVFNDEDLARVIAASKIPVISAIGHETDWTLTDLSADLRAPTPTAAAEMATPVKELLEISLSDLSLRFRRTILRSLANKGMILKIVASRFPNVDFFLSGPRRCFDEIINRLENTAHSTVNLKAIHFRSIRLTSVMLQRLLDETWRKKESLCMRINAAMLMILRNNRLRFHQTGKFISTDSSKGRRILLLKHVQDLALRQGNLLQKEIAKKKENLTQLERILQSISCHSVLLRGFVLVSDVHGNLVKGVSQISPNDLLELTFSDGKLAVKAHGPA